MHPPATQPLSTTSPRSTLIFLHSPSWLPLSSTLHNRHHILSTFLPSPTSTHTYQSAPSTHVFSMSTGATKPATPKRFCKGDDLIEDVPTGITGLEATATSSTSTAHPIPLFHSTSTHIAARCLASTVSSACSASCSHSSALVPASCDSNTEGALSHPSPHSVVVARSPHIVSAALLTTGVSPGLTGASPSPLLCVSPGAPGAPTLLTSVSPTSTVVT